MKRCSVLSLAAILGAVLVAILVCGHGSVCVANPTSPTKAESGVSAAIVRHPVESSNLRSVGYSREASVLEVEFHGGRVYQYYGVPLRIYEGLMKAESKGRYFDRNVKKGGYRYKRIK